MMIPCYLFDIDGTLADVSHRLHHIQKEPKDWDAFFLACHADPPIQHIVGLVWALDQCGKRIIFVSGRSDISRRETEDWLRGNEMYGPLYMRKHGDHRPDHLVKADMLSQIREDGFEPVMVFDDRDQVVKMWRAKGIPCAQVAEGAF